MKNIVLINLVEGLVRVENISILSEKELQQAYLFYLKKGKTDAINELKKLTKITPSRKVSIMAQEFALNSGKIGAIKGIQKVTGVKPEFALSTALDAYKKLNKVRTCHLIMPHQIKDIHKITGKRAPNNIVNSWYDTLIRNEDLTGIRVIENMTGIESKYRLEVEFLLLLRNGDFKMAEKIYRSNKSKLCKKYKGIESIFDRIKKILLNSP